MRPASSCLDIIGLDQQHAPAARVIRVKRKWDSFLTLWQKPLLASSWLCRLDCWRRVTGSSRRFTLNFLSLPIITLHCRVHSHILSLSFPYRSMTYRDNIETTYIGLKLLKHLPGKIKNEQTLKTLKKEPKIPLVNKAQYLMYLMNIFHPPSSQWWENTTVKKNCLNI